MVSGHVEHVASLAVDRVDAPAPATPVRPSARPALSALERALDAFAYSNLLPAAVGGVLTFAVTAALAGDAPPSPRAALLVACSTYFVYALDRLRDLDRDADVSPRRTAFVLAHRPALAVATSLAGLAAIALLPSFSAATLALCVPIGAVGLLHRRLKQRRFPKIAYVALAWTAAAVAIPALVLDRALDLELAVAAAAVGAGVLANLVASNLRAGKHRAPARAPAHSLAAARALVFAVALATAFAPAAVAPLAWIPAVQGIALCFFRDSERYAYVALDGALFVGGTLAIALRLF